MFLPNRATPELSLREFRDRNTHLNFGVTLKRSFGGADSGTGATYAWDGNKEVGRRLNAMLELGASRPWPDALEAFTGTRQMSGQAMGEYFAPLKAWLDQQNAGKTQGWHVVALEGDETSRFWDSDGLMSSSKIESNRPFLTGLPPALRMASAMPRHLARL